MQQQVRCCSELGAAHATAAWTSFKLLSSIPAAEADHNLCSQVHISSLDFTFQARQARARRLLTNRLRAEPSLALRWWRCSTTASQPRQAAASFTLHMMRPAFSSASASCSCSCKSSRLVVQDCWWPATSRAGTGSCQQNQAPSLFWGGCKSITSSVPVPLIVNLRYFSKSQACPDTMPGCDQRHETKLRCLLLLCLHVTS